MPQVIVELLENNYSRQRKTPELLKPALLVQWPNCGVEI